MCQLTIWVTNSRLLPPRDSFFPLCSRRGQQRQATYVNDQTTDPYWIDQTFLLDVPVDPSHSIRGYNVCLTMKSKSLVGRDTFLGEAEVPLTSLISEKELNGWFALKPKKHSQQTGVGPESLSFSSLVCGSIKVRIQWIHSMRALVEYIENEGKR
jgi:hypothetical protein